MASRNTRLVNKPLEIVGIKLNKIPADWRLAQNHAKARETKPEKQTVQGTFLESCPCCGYEIERETIDLDTPYMELGFLGSGFPLFYNYLIYCCVMLFCLFLVQGAPNIYLNLKGNNCNKTMLQTYDLLEKQKKRPSKTFIPPCPDSHTNKMSLANILNTMAKGELNHHFTTAAMAVQLILIIVFRRRQREIEKEVDIDHITPSDYTVSIKNIPQSLPDPKKELQNLLYSKQYNVAKINLVYDISEVEQAQEQMKDLIKEKQEILLENKANFNDPKVREVNDKITACEQNISKAEQNCITDPKKFTGFAFVSLTTEKDKLKLLEENQFSGFQRFINFFGDGSSEKQNETLYLKDRHLYVEQAAEPNDIDWEFAHCSTSDKIWARIGSFFKWAALIAISFFAIVLLSYYQNEKMDHMHEEVLAREKKRRSRRKITEEDNDKIDNHMSVIGALSILISTVIVLFNKFLLPYLVHHIVDSEKWSTKSKLNISFAFKLTIALFFNTSLITILVEVVLFKNYFGIGGGMIYNEELVFIMNAIIPTLAWVIDPWTLYKNHKRNTILGSPEAYTLTQGEANELMEHPTYAMGKRYADIMKTMWFTFFFAPVIPIGSAISFVGLVMYYFADKYNLIHRRTVKESINYELSFQMIELLEYSIVFHCFGQFFFKWLFVKTIDHSNLVILAISIFISILPMGSLNEALFPMEAPAEKKQYFEVQNTFDTDYDRENPITKHQALQAFSLSRSVAKPQLNINNPTKFP